VATSQSNDAHSTERLATVSPGFQVPPSERMAHVPASPCTTDLLRETSELEAELRGRFGVDLGQYAASSHTDAMLIVHRGRAIWEFSAYPDGGRLLHPVMSCSKVVCGTLAGVLADRQILDPRMLVTEYVRELRNTSFAGATVRQLLDMTTGTAFNEEYVDGEPTLAERARGLGPSLTRGYYEDGIMRYAQTVPNARIHGEVFNYRSILIDVLAQVLERAGGGKYADLLGRYLWGPIGAQDDALVFLDPFGRPFASVGMWISPRDLLRLGTMWISHGLAQDGTRILSGEWVNETWCPSNGARRQFRGSPYRLSKQMPGGWFRNGWWGLGADTGAIVALGIYGQVCFLHRDSETVVVKVSQWPRPESDSLMAQQIQVGRQIVETLSAR